MFLGDGFWIAFRSHSRQNVNRNGEKLSHLAPLIEGKTHTQKTHALSAAGAHTEDSFSYDLFNELTGEARLMEQLKIVLTFWIFA